ncbi:unnamed protein product [Dovyalis caffra]|uniref:Uncharacterized protein n=1 Tax=Dovyalis caffra TaxID=77055 RepID=A0AAV1QYR2_9ROSI|nr:unnamed protein product [Dovyalis caffra]
MGLEYGSGSSKHSESHPEVIDGSGSSDHEDTYPRLLVRIESSDHFQTDSDKIDGSVSSKNSESHSEVINGSDSSKRTEPKTGSTVIEGDLYIPTIKLGSSSFSSSSSSSPSSSSSSSLYDLFDAIVKESTDFESSNKSHEVTQSASEDHDNGISVDNSNISEEKEDGSPDHTLTHPVSDVTHESLVRNISPTQSPPLQAMERPGGYDPFRIPSSIFEKNKGTTPMDWSVASNESLFSIHPTPPSAMVAADNQSLVPDVENYKQKGEANGIADNTIKGPAEYQNKENKPNQAVSWKSASNHSYGSGDSAKSFSFPILERNASGLAGRSTTVNGQAAPILIVAGRSATIGTVAEKDGDVIDILSMINTNGVLILANGMRSSSLKGGVKQQQQQQQHLQSPPALVIVVVTVEKLSGVVKTPLIHLMEECFSAPKPPPV